MESKRGMNTIMIIPAIFIVFFLIIIIGIGLYYVSIFDNSMSSINVKIGAVNFNDTYKMTIKPIVTNAYNTFDTWGISLELGLIIVMCILAFSFRKENRLWIILDLFIIIIAEIIAILIQNSYNTFINSNADLFNIYSTNLTKSSIFLLRLPLIIPVTGALIMILTYATLNKKKKEEPNVFDYITQ